MLLTHEKRFSVITTILFTFITLPSFAASRSTSLAEESFPTSWKNAATSQVQLDGEMGRRIDLTIDSHLLKLEFEKEFLTPYRTKRKTDGFIGLGMLLDAVVGFADYRRDEELIDLKERLIDETLKTQAEDGYIGIMRLGSRVVRDWDVHAAAHLIIALVHDYHAFGEKRSLDAAVRLGDYVAKEWAATVDLPLSEQPGQGIITQTMATTDFGIACVALYQATGESRFADYLIKLRKVYEWDGKIRKGRWTKIAGHAYAHLAMCVSQLQFDQIRPDARLRAPSEMVKRFIIDGDGAAIIGTVGFWECWHDTQDVSCALGETCASAYLLRWCDELIRQKQDPLWGHVMERTIYNALFAAQSTDGRKIRYYVDLEGPRTYHSVDSYCCPSNFRRVISELPKYVYYTTDDGGITISQYNASTATLSLKGNGSSKTKTVKLTQVTDYPSSGKITITIDQTPPGKFPIRLRIPSWCDEPEVSVNGRKIAGPLDSKRWCVLDRDWKSGDQIELNFPMRWRWVRGRKAQSGRVALMRGPLVFALSRERNQKVLGDQRLERLVIDTTSVQGPMPDDSVRPGGLACTIKAWSPKANYPLSAPKMTLTLTEVTDPASSQTYLKLASPEQEGCENDELFGVGRK